MHQYYILLYRPVFGQSHTPIWLPIMTPEMKAKVQYLKSWIHLNVMDHETPATTTKQFDSTAMGVQVSEFFFISPTTVLQ